MEDLDKDKLICTSEVEVRIFTDNFVWFMLGYHLVSIGGSDVSGLVCDRIE